MRKLKTLSTATNSEISSEIVNRLKFKTKNSTQVLEMKNTLKKNERKKKKTNPTSRVKLTKQSKNLWT